LLKLLKLLKLLNRKHFPFASKDANATLQPLRALMQRRVAAVGVRGSPHQCLTGIYGQLLQRKVCRSCEIC